MAGFRFALQPLLKARRHQEQTAQLGVAELERERLTVEDRIRRKQRALSSGRRDLRTSLTGHLHLASLRGHAGSALRLMRDAQRDVLELAGVHKRLDAARATLLVATTSRRAVELLKQRRLEAWQRREDRRETDALDELAVFSAARKENTP